MASPLRLTSKLPSATRDARAAAGDTAKAGGLRGYILGPDGQL
jgi:hypothetical protein